MPKLVECVPNFSEGRDEAKINAGVDAARAVPGVIILDVEKDADHNRTVLTFIASVDSAVEACFQVVKKSAELIDLNKHKGEHPRMGATDVAPFIPIMGSTVEDCVALAAKLGERIGAELDIPVYLYDLAARRPERKNLADVRKGQFEGLREEIGKNPAKTPDFGPNHIHPTAGAIAVGARQQIVNFNVNLDTKDMDFGKALAKKIRASSGGLPCVRGKEIYLESKGQVQLSTVLTDYRTTSIKRVVDEVEKEIAPKGIKITGTELIGLTTQDALTRYALESLKVENFNMDAQILETRITELMTGWQAGAGNLVEALSAPTPSPGGGSAAAAASAMGAALGIMALGLSLQSKKLEEEKKRALRAPHARLLEIKNALTACVAEDARAFDVFMAARKMPKESPDRPKAIQAAIRYAAEVPLKTARLSRQAMDELAKTGADIYAPVMSDFNSALHLLKAGAACAAENVRINLYSIEDKEYAAMLAKELDSLVKQNVPAQL
ncbi:MAG: glutamate formimidoyltransferase [Elusimicrobiales bacterium]|nr:glutamate formimidoyltransferase [Elusimicrobiales bacterium]